MGFLFVFCSNKSKTFPGQVGRVVLQRPSDGTNSLVTSRLILQPRYVLLHRPSRSTQACGHPAPRAAEPGKNLPAMQEVQVRSFVQDDLVEKRMATCSILAWRIPRTDEPGGL